MATVPTEVSELEFTGNGATDEFPITFPIQRTADLVVDLLLDGEEVPTVQVEGVDYSVDEAPSDAPTVTMTVAPPADSTLRVRRTVPITQEVNLLTQGPFSPKTLTEMADKGVMIAQQLHRRLRALESAGAVGAVVAGDGLEYDGNVLHVRPGDGIVVGADEVEVDFSSDPAELSDVSKSAANAGVLDLVARADHKHDVSTAAAVELTDSSNAEGNATTLARSNHTHAHGNRGGGTLHANADSTTAGFMSAADKNALDLLVARSHAAATMATGGQVLTAGASAAPVVFDSETYDTNEEYNPANGRFTATVTGYYRVSALVRATVGVALADADYLAINLYRDGTILLEGEVKASQAASGDRLVVQLAHTILLTAGQYLEVRCSCGGQDFTVNQKSYLAIDRL